MQWLRPIVAYHQLIIPTRKAEGFPSSLDQRQEYTIKVTEFGEERQKIRGYFGIQVGYN
jgi:hypothetical protein